MNIITFLPNKFNEDKYPKFLKNDLRVNDL